MQVDSIESGRYQVTFIDRSEFIEVYTQELVHNKIFLSGRAFPGLGYACRIVLCFPVNGDEMELSGIIERESRNAPYGVLLRFPKLESVVKEKIEAYLMELLCGEIPQRYFAKESPSNSAFSMESSDIEKDALCLKESSSQVAFAEMKLLKPEEREVSSHSSRVDSVCVSEEFELSVSSEDDLGHEISLDDSEDSVEGSRLEHFAQNRSWEDLEFSGFEFEGDENYALTVEMAAVKNSESAGESFLDLSEQDSDSMVFSYSSSVEPALSSGSLQAVECFQSGEQFLSTSSVSRSYSAKEHLEQNRALTQSKEQSEERQQKKREQNNTHAKIRELTIQQKIRLASRGSRFERSVLMREPQPMVHQALLRNPQLTTKEVVLLAKNPQSGVEAIRLIANNKQWMSDFSIRRHIVTNPKTNIDLATKYLKTMPKQQVERIAKSQSVKGALSQAAKRILQQKKR